MKLVIKNMVCPRCVMAVEQLLKDADAATPVYVRLGEVLLAEPLTPEQLEQVGARLRDSGFELLDSVRKQQVEKIKAIVIREVHYGGEVKFPFAEVLSRELHREYSQLSKLFSETEGLTIEQFVILQKIEKTKELLAYNEMNLSEISFKLGYSSVAHLSAQFKKVTGMTPSRFKSQGIHLRKPLDGVVAGSGEGGEVRPQAAWER